MIDPKDQGALAPTSSTADTFFLVLTEDELKTVQLGLEYWREANTETLGVSTCSYERETAKHEIKVCDDLDTRIEELLK